MRGKNREDVARYAALHWSLYQAQVALYDTQLELDKQSDCPNNHSFRAGFKTDEEGRIVGIETNLHIDPDGRVVCRLCRNERGLAYRQQIADGKIRGVMAR